MIINFFLSQIDGSTQAANEVANDLANNLTIQEYIFAALVVLMAFFAVFTFAWWVLRTFAKAFREEAQADRSHDKEMRDIERGQQHENFKGVVGALENLQIANTTSIANLSKTLISEVGQSTKTITNEIAHVGVNVENASTYAKKQHDSQQLKIQEILTMVNQHRDEMNVVIQGLKDIRTEVARLRESVESRQRPTDEVDLTMRALQGFVQSLEKRFGPTFTYQDYVNEQQSAVNERSGDE